MSSPEATPIVGRAVRYDAFGDIAVLDVVPVTVDPPVDGEVLVAVHAAGTNPGEAAIRKGYFNAFVPSTFPSGQGSDFAGTIIALGGSVDGFAVGDEVFGWSNRRNTQATHLSVPVGQFVLKPAEVGWPIAGSLYVAGCTAFAAVRAVALSAGDTVVISGAAGGVGSIAVQLAVATGATVIGIASEANHDWLRDRGVKPVAYGDGLAERIRNLAPAGVDALVDTFGPEYVYLAIELGVNPDRIDTIISFDAAKETGAQTDGSSAATDTAVLTELAARVASGALIIEIAATFALEDVRLAYTELEKHHTRGKIVLIP